MTKQANNQAEKKQENALPEESQVVDYLMSHPDFFMHHAPLLHDLQIPHESGGAVSLVERQVLALREKNQEFENKLRDMVDAVHDNQRLHVSLHRLAVSLFAADSLDDMLGIVDDELRHKLGTDFVYFRLTTDESMDISSMDISSNEKSHTYVAQDDELLQGFSKLIEEKRIQCGRFSEEQISQLFMQDDTDVKSAAVIPVSDAGIRGIIALGSTDEQRYHPGMGTDFLTSLADLISAAMQSYIAHLSMNEQAK